MLRITPRRFQHLAGLRLCRNLTFSHLRLQETRKPHQEQPNEKSASFPSTQPTSSDPTTSELKPKKRPLSRVAIGGSQNTDKKYATTNSVEFSAWKAVVLLVALGGGVTWWFAREKERLRIQKEVESKRGHGKPLIGGPFDLIDTEGNQFTDANLKNDEKKFSIIYFGFTHCPDVCPDELDKLGEMLDELKNENGIELQPIFITCDPARDTPDIIKLYLQDFHPSIVGLTGTYEKIKLACKKYRVYFSTPPDVKPGQDYLVDHSIFFYLMDSEGEFVDVIGREATAKEGVEKIKKHVDAFIPQSEREARQSSWLSFLYK
jgi:protein SCO1/2